MHNLMEDKLEASVPYAWGAKDKTIGYGVSSAFEVECCQDRERTAKGVSGELDGCGSWLITLDDRSQDILSPHAYRNFLHGMFSLSW